MKITGTIPFELTIDENDNWDITYENSLDNDMAIIAISQSILEVICANLSLEKKKATGKDLKHIKNVLEKGMAARFGSQLICEYMQAIYMSYKKAHPEVADVEIDPANPTEEQKSEITEELKKVDLKIVNFPSNEAKDN